MNQMTKTPIVVNGKPVYITPTGYKATHRGKVLAPAQLYAQLSKGQRRKLRKAARKLGFVGHARAVTA
jgi:hypothetical protein